MILTTQKSFINIIWIHAKLVEPSTITCSGDWIPSLILKVPPDKKISSPEGASSSRARNIQFSSNAKVRVESKNERSHDVREREREYSYRINFSELQRLNLRKLQHKLIRHAVNLRYNASEPTGWAEDLRQYGKHVQLPKDPFYVTGERFIERCMLQVAMKNRENEIGPLQDSEAVGEWETEDVQPVPIGGTRDRNFQQAWMKDSRKRIGVAMVGGIFLIADVVDGLCTILSIHC
ncbi:hypothetical protein DPV78_002150 [Talaromyces pinophilus]|nr:hypothetical protein DPV78_002150 [Talaromyces pinophilus]